MQNFVECVDICRENFPNERIQTLHKFVSSCIEHNIKMIIDLKAKDWKIVKIINDLYKEFPELYSLAIVSSFNPFIIYKVSILLNISLYFTSLIFHHDSYQTKREYFENRKWLTLLEIL